MIQDWFSSNSTYAYDGIVVSNNNDGRWNIKYNGEIHPIKLYGSILPSINSMVKVIVPQGNQNLAWFFVNSDKNTEAAIDELLLSIQNLPFQHQTNLTLPTSGWTSNNGQYYQTINVSNMTSSSTPIFIPQWSSNASTQNNEKNIWNSLIAIQPFNGYIQIFSSISITTPVSFTAYY